MKIFVFLYYSEDISFFNFLAKKIMCFPQCSVMNDTHVHTLCEQYDLKVASRYFEGSLFRRFVIPNRAYASLFRRFVNIPNRA